MKLLVVACLLAVIVLVHSERCQDKDPLTCTMPCGPNQVHGCHDDRCYCRTGHHCLDVTDCDRNEHCHDSDQHIHCIDGECQCIKIDN